MKIFNFYALFSLLLFLACSSLVADSSNPLTSEMMQEIGEHLIDRHVQKTGEALLSGVSLLGEGLKNGINDLSGEISRDLSENISRGLSEGTGRGIAKGLDDISKEMGTSLSRNFGHQSTFQGDLQEITRASGKSLSTFLDGIGDRLFPFILKYGGYTAAALVLMTSGYYGTKTLYRIIEHRYTNPKPRVIIESSKDLGWFMRMKRWIFGGPKSPEMIFPAQLKERLENIVKATKNISAKIQQGKKNIKYRNTLLYGPPGTGKTMFAMQLARESGMEFVLVTGSSFFQPGAGIAAVDELFTWAKKCKKGLCIFIDEADSLLSGRDKMDPTSENYRIVNHFLNHLGQRSNKFMLILATNYPTIFDEAMQRRIDDAIEMPLPGAPERFATLCHYRNTILKDVKQNGKAFVDAANKCFNDKKINEVVKLTEGFSYGDLEGIINTLKSEADITEDGTPNTELVDHVVQYALEKKHAFKDGYLGYKLTIQNKENSIPTTAVAA